MTDRIVLTMKWGDVFPPSYVNRLFSAVTAHLDGAFKFVCLTNEPEGLDEGITHFPMPDLDLPAERYAHGAWPKLSVFRADLYGLSGRCLFIDLDTVICGNLEPFFDFKSPFAAIGAGDNWRRDMTVTDPELASGVFAFDLGSLSHVLDAFLSDKEDAYAQYPNEQTFIEGQLEAWDAWPSSWIVSFKRHLCQPIGLDLFLPPRAPDAATKIVAFHGDPRPIDLVGRKGLWTNLPHSVRCPIKWLDDYWERYADPSA